MSIVIVEKARELWNTLKNNTGRRPEAHRYGAVNVSLSRSIAPTPSRFFAMKSYLKVKIKSLAEEATIIRHEERRVKRAINWWRTSNGPVKEYLDNHPPSIHDAENHMIDRADSIERYQNEYLGLHNHRTYQVRNESRASQLAYAYIQGYPYSRVEDPTKTRKPVPIYRVATLAMKYGNVPIPPDTHYNNRLLVAANIIQAWVEGKTKFPVEGTNGQVLRSVVPK